jgi:hypothetical protein
MRSTSRWALSAAVGVALAATGVGSAAVRAVDTEDDLAVVKRAVAQSAAPESPAPPVTAAPQAAPSAAEPRKPAAPAARTEKPRWLRIRVVDKQEKKGKVSVNVPLALVQALGDDVPIDLHCNLHRDGSASDRCRIKLSEVLATLQSGQNIVEVDDEEGSVRIWVD